MLRANVCNDGGNTGTVIVSPKALVHSWDKEHHHQLCAAVLKFGHISSRDASSDLDLMFACSALKGIAKSVEVFVTLLCSPNIFYCQALDKLV